MPAPSMGDAPDGDNTSLAGPRCSGGLPMTAMCPWQHRVHKGAPDSSGASLEAPGAGALDARLRCRHVGDGWPPDPFGPHVPLWSRHAGESGRSTPPRVDPGGNWRGGCGGERRSRANPVADAEHPSGGRGGSRRIWCIEGTGGAHRPSKPRSRTRRAYVRFFYFFIYLPWRAKRAHPRLIKD